MFLSILPVPKCKNRGTSFWNRTYNLVTIILKQSNLLLNQKLYGSLCLGNSYEKQQSIQHRSSVLCICLNVTSLKSYTQCAFCNVISCEKDTQHHSRGNLHLQIGVLTIQFVFWKWKTACSQLNIGRVTASWFVDAEQRQSLPHQTIY